MDIDDNAIIDYFKRSPDYVFLLDASGRLLFANDIAERLWESLTPNPKHLNDIVSSCITSDKHLFAHDAVHHLLNPQNHYRNWDTDLRASSTQTVPVLLSISTTPNRNYLAIAKSIKEQKTSEALISSEQQLYQIVFNNISEAVFLAPIDDQGMHHNFVAVNDTACKKLGYTRDELLRMNARSLNPSANIEKVKAMGRKIQREKTTFLEAVHVASDGTQIPVAVVARSISIGNQDFVLSVARDLREVKALQKTEERFARLLEWSWDELYIFDSGQFRFVHLNQGALNNLGYTSEELQSKHAFELLIGHDEKSFRQLIEPLTSGEKNVLIFEATLKRKNNTHYPVEVRLQLSQNEVPPVFLANVLDITLRKQSEQKLNFLANYDILTGLPNRALFFDRLSVAIEQCKRTDTLSALVFLDVDSFKTVNDSMGHDAGDELIKIIAQRLLDSVRKSDTVARLGGDEFTLIMTNIKQLFVVEQFTQKILDQVAKPVVIDGQEFSITASMGVSIFPFAESDDPYALLKQADTAMYQAKAKGKNAIQFYTETTAREELKRVKYEHALKTALEKNQFFILVQPRVSIATGELVGGEVLLRWRHPELGIVSPIDFIPLLENSGKIKEVGLWVVEQTCQFIAEDRLDTKGINLSVNVAAKQLDDANFFSQIKTIVERHKLAPGHVELEITETVLLARNDTVVRSLQLLDEFGINISLDDFGTGYSSLSYLRQFPIKTLKIDRSFVKDLATNKDNQSIVEAIIGLAKNLRLHLVAEGIEDKTQADLLFSMGCFEGQGFYYHKPIYPHEFRKLTNK